MGKIILKPNVQVSQTDNLFAFEIDRQTQWDSPKKIMSRNVPELLGLNQYNSVGYAVLSRNSLLKSDQIDPYYTVRGAIAEYFVAEYLHKIYRKKGIEIETISFDTKEQGFDMFKGNSRFGGVVDIAIEEPQRVVVEVKSKEETKLNEIARQGQYPIEELWQGLTLAHLYGTPKLVMAYAFIKNEKVQPLKDYVGRDKWGCKYKTAEQIIKELGLGLNDFVYHLKTYDLSDFEIEQELEKCHQILMANSNNLSARFEIPQSMFYDKEIAEIKKYIKKN